VKRIVIKVLRLYQLMISPLIGQCCRFYPTCSNYMIEAVETHGVCRGVWLGSKRLLKCHPLHPGGVDPVPATVQTRIDVR
jgi:uncharacterized protein